VFFSVCFDMYVYVWFLNFFQLITLLCICMYGLCPCACVAYDLIKVMLLFAVVSSTSDCVYRDNRTFYYKQYNYPEKTWAISDKKF